MSSPLPQSRVRVQRIAEAAVERARLSVVPRVRTRAARVPFMMLVSLVLVAGVVGLLMFNTSMQQSSFTATALESHASDLNSRKQTLQMELEVLRDPQRVAEEAQALGMVPAGQTAFIQLSDGKVIGTAAPATIENRFDIRPPKAKKPPALDPEPIVIRVPHGSREGRADTGDRANRADTASSSTVAGARAGRNGETDRQPDRRAR